MWTHDISHCNSQDKFAAFYPFFFDAVTEQLNKNPRIHVARKTFSDFTHALYTP